MNSGPGAVELGLPVPAAGEGRAPASRFWFHLAGLGFLYLTVVVAWGQRNSWPDELLLSVLTVPISGLVARQLFRSEHFGLEVDSETGQQEQLIASLVLAVGLASGQLLLMSVGLVCLGIGWLRPQRRDVDWAEWLKVPFLFLTALPFWLDFDGSRAGFARLLGNAVGNPVYRLPLELATSQARVLGYCGLLALALVLRGRAFWLALPLLPVFLAAITVLPLLVPDWAGLPVTLRLWVPWGLGAAAIGALAKLTRRLDAPGHSMASGRMVRRWFANRRHPPWLAVMVVTVVQALPFQTPRLGPHERLELAGMAVLALLLGILRLRTTRGPIHSRSTAMVAGALALTLLAEFTTSDQARHLALGFVLIGLFSWHCFWPLRIFAMAGTITTLLLGIPGSGLPAPFGSESLFAVRLALAGLLLGVLAWLVFRPLPLPGAQGYDESGWVPPKRFALILLGLMMLFQTASAFWPEHQIRFPGQSRTTEEIEPEMSPAALLRQTGPLAPRGPVQTTIAYPRRNPYLLESPVRMLQRRGWQVVRTERFPHPKGEAIGVELANGDRRASALWWFEVGGAAFGNHLYARRVLWSSWHLANRSLRYVRLESSVLTDPADLVRHAVGQHWFADDDNATPE